MSRARSSSGSSSRSRPRASPSPWSPGACCSRSARSEYAGVGFLQAKLALVAVGTLAALALHHAHGFLLDTASDSRLAGHAILSLVCWPAALLCGRLIAFAGD